MPGVSTDGHAGNLIVGSLGARDVAIFQGRVHCHDGLPPSEVAFGVRMMILAGVKHLIVTNAAGSIREGIGVGDLMVIDNHVSLFLPQDPALHLEHPQLGEKFYPQTDPYDQRLGDLFLEEATRRGWGKSCHRGVYCFLPGPRYESRADIKFLRTMGVADAVGMSTVPEVLAGLQMSRGALRVLGVSTITNVAAGLSHEDPNHEEVKAAGIEAAPRLRELIAHVVKSL
jgi:purine-nucleoside phosphorylase